MKRKIIGLIAALVLAAVGTVSLVAYVQSAKDDAAAGEELVEVYVVQKPLNRGASATDIRGALKVERVPVKVRAANAITDLSVIPDDAVAAVDLQVGEQLLTTRVAKKASLIKIPVPDGFQEVTIPIEPVRAVGGEIRPGDTVGVIVSFDAFEFDVGGRTLPGGTTASPDATDAPKPRTPNATHLAFHKVLVTNVQLTGAPAAAPAAGTGVGTAPAGALFITLALNSAEVEQVVFAAEFGRIWLTLENEKADTSGTRIVTLNKVFEPGVER